MHDAYCKIDEHSPRIVKNESAEYIMFEQIAIDVPLTPYVL